jgi:hypothetical protein
LAPVDYLSGNAHLVHQNWYRISFTSQKVWHDKDSYLLKYFMVHVYGRSPSMVTSPYELKIERGLTSILTKWNFLFVFVYIFRHNVWENVKIEVKFYCQLKNLGSLNFASLHQQWVLLFPHQMRCL